MFKIMCAFESVDCNVDGGLRGHEHSVEVNRWNFLSNEVVGPWINLLDYMVLSLDADISKNNYDWLINSNGISLYLGLFYANRLGNNVHNYIFCLVVSE